MILNWKRRPHSYALAGESFRITWPRSAGLAGVVVQVDFAAGIEWTAAITSSATVVADWRALVSAPVRVVVSWRDTIASSEIFRALRRAVGFTEQAREIEYTEQERGTDYKSER